MPTNKKPASRATASTRPAQAWQVITVRPNSHIIRFEGIRAGWEQWVLLSSDRHHDNVQTRHDLELEHLQQAEARQALVVDAGDLFCAMQGKYDPRASMDSLRPEHKRGDYLDALVETAVAFYQPYAHLFALVGRGNHETAIRKRYGTDLTDRFTSELRRAGSQVVSGEYAGWLTFQFFIHTTVRRAKVLHYFHGAGGGGPVTRGVIATNRDAVNFPDADILLSGHTHDHWVVPVKRHRLTAEGLPYDDIAWHVRTPTYKDEQQTGSGWAIEKGHNPKPLGCVWARFYLANSDSGEIRVDIHGSVA